MKQRYTKYDPILNFYKRNPKLGINELCIQDGYKYNTEKGMKNWFVKYVSKLEKRGYTHNIETTAVTGGDNDYLIIDHEKMEYCFWENGFWPFCGSPKDFPTDGDLNYWSNNRQ